MLLGTGQRHWNSVCIPTIQHSGGQCGILTHTRNNTLRLHVWSPDTCCVDRDVSFKPVASRFASDKAETIDLQVCLRAESSDLQVCLRAESSDVLVCQRAESSDVLVCQRAESSDVLVCQRAESSDLQVCLRAESSLSCNKWLQHGAVTRLSRFL